MLCHVSSRTGDSRPTTGAKCTRTGAGGGGGGCRHVATIVAANLPYLIIAPVATAMCARVLFLANAKPCDSSWIKLRRLRIAAHGAILPRVPHRPRPRLLPYVGDSQARTWREVSFERACDKIRVTGRLEHSRHTLAIVREGGSVVRTSARLEPRGGMPAGATALEFLTSACGCTMPRHARTHECAHTHTRKRTLAQVRALARPP